MVLSLLCLLLVVNKDLKILEIATKGRGNSKRALGHLAQWNHCGLGSQADLVLDPSSISCWMMTLDKFLILSELSGGIKHNVCVVCGED